MTEGITAQGVQTGLGARACCSVIGVRMNVELRVSMFDGQVRRNIDQYGMMIAGLWSLTNNGSINRDFVAEIVDEIESAESIEFGDDEKDETNCLNAIMDCVVSAEMGTEDHPHRQAKTIGELIDACDTNFLAQENKEQAQNALKQYGIKANDDGVFIANRNKELSDLLKGTSFQSNWSTFLTRLVGSSKTEPIRFAGKVISRAKLVPWGLFREAAEGTEANERNAKIPF